VVKCRVRWHFFFSFSAIILANEVLVYSILLLFFFSFLFFFCCELYPTGSTCATCEIEITCCACRCKVLMGWTGKKVAREEEKGLNGFMQLLQVQMGRVDLC
jgi:hypothetical protein